MLIKRMWGTVQFLITAAITFYAWFYGYLGGRRDGYDYAMHTFTAPIPECPTPSVRTSTEAILKMHPSGYAPTHPALRAAALPHMQTSNVFDIRTGETL